MSKYQLVINSDDPNEISALLSALNSSTATISMTPAGVSAVGGISQPGNNDDDETSDADAIPGTLDANGLPWDDRIHSTPAKLTSKKVWRRRKGVEDAFVAGVEAELRARSAGQQPQQTMQQQPAPLPVQQQPMQQPVPLPQPGQYAPVEQHQPVYQPQPGQYAPVEQQQPAPLPVQTQPMQQPVYQQPVSSPLHQVPAQQPQQFAPVAAVAGLDFNAFMQKVQQLLQQRDAAGAPLVDAQYLQTVAADVGTAFGVQLGAITDIMNNQQMIDKAVQIMANAGKWM